MSDPFEAGLVDRLCSEYPETAVEKLADQIQRRWNLGKIERPNAALIGAVRHASEDGKNLRDVPALPPPAGMFHSNGSWAQDGHGDPAFHRFVDMLVTARRRGYEPDRIAERILLEPGCEVPFPNVNSWLKSEKPGWLGLPAATSAERRVIDAGYGGSIAVVESAW